MESSGQLIQTDRLVQQCEVISTGMVYRLYDD